MRHMAPVLNTDEPVSCEVSDLMQPNTFVHALGTNAAAQTSQFMRPTQYTDQLID